MKHILLMVLLAFSFNVQAFSFDEISAWSKTKITPIAYQIETSGTNLRGYTWCDPAMKVYIFYGVSSSKGGNFSVSNVACKPKK